MRRLLIFVWRALELVNRATGGIASWMLTTVMGVFTASFSTLRSGTEVVSRGLWVVLVSFSRIVAEALFASSTPGLADSGYHVMLVAGSMAAAVAVGVLASSASQGKQVSQAQLAWLAVCAVVATVALVLFVAYPDVDDDNALCAVSAQLEQQFISLDGAIAIGPALADAEAALQAHEQTLKVLVAEVAALRANATATRKQGAIVFKVSRDLDAALAADRAAAALDVRAVKAEAQVGAAEDMVRAGREVVRRAASRDAEVKALLHKAEEVVVTLRRLSDASAMRMTTAASGSRCPAWKGVRLRFKQQQRRLFAPSPRQPPLPALPSSPSSSPWPSL